MTGVFLVGPGHVPHPPGARAARLHRIDDGTQVGLVRIGHPGPAAGLLHRDVVPGALAYGAGGFLPADRAPTAGTVGVVVVCSEPAGEVRGVGRQRTAADVEVAETDVLVAGLPEIAVQVLHGIDRKAVADRQDADGLVVGLEGGTGQVDFESGDFSRLEASAFREGDVPAVASGTGPDGEGYGLPGDVPGSQAEPDVAGRRSVDGQGVAFAEDELDGSHVTVDPAQGEFAVGAQV